MYYKRKAYHKLLDWKQHYSDKYAILLEGARRVGKSTIAENFAKNTAWRAHRRRNHRIHPACRHILAFRRGVLLLL